MFAYSGCVVEELRLCGIGLKELVHDVDMWECVLASWRQYNLHTLDLVSK